MNNASGMGTFQTNGTGGGEVMHECASVVDISTQAADIVAGRAAARCRSVRR
jgi:hypothetical protein